MRVGLLVNPAGANRLLVERQVVAAARERGMATVVEEASQSDALGPALDCIASVIFDPEPSSARAVRALAPNLPIVCPNLGDHLHDLFASYARPGGSVTGIAINVEGVHAKVVELAHDALPGLMRVGLLVNPAGANRLLVERQVVAAARERGMATVVEEASQSDALGPALDCIAKAGSQSLIVQPNGLFINQRNAILRQAIAVGLPTIFDDRGDVEAGGFMSYGVNQREGSRRAAAFVDKILKGAKPGDLPVEFSTKVELAINLKTARALGLEIPPTLLARADEVIE